MKQGRSLKRVENYLPGIITKIFLLGKTLVFLLGNINRIEKSLCQYHELAIVDKVIKRCELWDIWIESNSKNKKSDWPFDPQYDLILMFLLCFFSLSRKKDWFYPSGIINDKWFYIDFSYYIYQKIKNSFCFFS